MKKGEKFPLIDREGVQDNALEFVMENLAPNAKTFAAVFEDIIVLEDEKNPLCKNHIRWIVWNIPASERVSGSTLNGKTNSGSKNAGQRVIYGSPSHSDLKPPEGGKHLYWLTIYVLDKEIHLKLVSTKEHFLKKIRKHIIQQGCLVGEYE